MISEITDFKKQKDSTFEIGILMRVGRGASEGNPLLGGGGAAQEEVLTEKFCTN